MTNVDEGKLRPPDLSELMSQIIRAGKEDERLVFVEYDPATRAFYDHVGLPEYALLMQKRLQQAKNDSKSWEEFLIKLSDDAKMPAWLKNVFPKKLAEMAKSLLRHQFDLLLDAIDVNKIDNPKRFLVCIARSKNENNEKDWNWLKDNRIDLEKMFHWIIQQVPQPRRKGGAGERKVHGWEKVDNKQSEIEAFSELAGLEFIFGMRKKTRMEHVRFNVFLDTGEYVGQMIAFTDALAKSAKQQQKAEREKEKRKLLANAVEAAELVRRVLPDIRQARYMDAILSGGEGGKLEHVLVRHLPTLIPVEKLYVRNIDRDKNSNAIGGWDKFFKDEPKIFSHSPVEKAEAKDSFDHFKQRQWDGKKPENSIETAINNAPSKKWENGFINWKQQEGIVLAFSTLAPELTEGGLAVIAIIDKDYFPAKLYDSKQGDTFENAFENPNKCLLTDDGKAYRLSSKRADGSDSSEIDLPLDSINRSSCFSRSEIWRRYLEKQLSTTLAVVLEPRHPLRNRLIQAKKEGKAYCEQYGTTIYGQSYLNVEDNNDRWGNSKDFRVILNTVSYTQEKLTDTLYEPRGYRAIARVIFDRFFCHLWKHFKFGGDPAESDPNADHYTPLGSLVREALDFEDTLRLEGGYREHFVHSYHVFLLGLYLVEKLSLTEKFGNDRLKAWFLVSMYHDIGYPIQKMEDITKKYLDRLNPSMEKKLGDDIAIDVKIGFGKLLASDLLGARLKAITDTLVNELAVDLGNKDEDATRREQVQKLTEYLGSNYHKQIDWPKYKRGMEHTFYQYCLRLALNYGEHGIISSLLFGSAARCLDSETDIKTRREVSVAILGHHMLDEKGTWSLTKDWTLQRSKPKETKPEQDITDEQANEMAQSIAWDPAFFAHELRKESNNSRFLGTLLILCDTVSQWGRTDDENDKKLALLRNRSDDDPLVVLCYPKMTDTGPAEKLLSHYESQLMYIAGPSVGFVNLKYNCSSYQKAPDNMKTAVKCSECKEDVVTVKGKQGTLLLNSKPRAFPDVIQAHEKIGKAAEKK